MLVRAKKRRKRTNGKISTEKVELKQPLKRGRPSKRGLKKLSHLQKSNDKKNKLIFVKKRESSPTRNNRDYFTNVICSKRNKTPNKKFLDFEIPPEIKSALNKVVQSRRTSRYTNTDVMKPIKRKRLKVSNRMFLNGMLKKPNGSFQKAIYDIRYFLCCNNEPAVNQTVMLGFAIGPDNMTYLQSFEDRWQINVVMMSKTVVMILFNSRTNSERHVAIGTETRKCDINFGSCAVTLSGAPQFINTFKDLQILLNIIDEVRSDDPVVEYISR